MTTWILIFDRGNFLCWFEDETYITVTSSAESSRPYVPTKCDISMDHDDKSHLIVVLTRPLHWRNYLELHVEPQVWSCCFFYKAVDVSFDTLIRSYSTVMWHIFVVYMLLFVVTAQSHDTSLLFTCSYSQLQHSHVTHLCCLHALIRRYSTVTWHIFVVYMLLFAVTAQSRDTSLLFTCSYSQIQHNHVTPLLFTCSYS